MDARSRVQNGLAKAFSRNDKLGQAYYPFTATRQVSGDYVPGSGTSSGTPLEYSGHYWRSEWTFTELQTLNVGAQDIKIGMLANATEQVPQVDDRLVLGDGTKARVTQVSPDPVAATYTVMLEVN